MRADGHTISITLEYADSVLYQIYADDISSDITIGRSKDNKWILPPEDTGAHRHHAVIRRLPNGKLMIADCESRESIYYMGSPVKEHRLKPGDLCSIGDSKLLVREISQERKTGLLYNQLEQLAGKEKGRIYRIMKNRFKIGSARDSDCLIDDSLVSKLHAVVEQQSDGTCHIMDNNSRNGTMVNGETLVAGESGRRMLKDGDIISIAYVELKFWDKKVVHVRSHLVIKLCAVIATMAVAIGGYFGFQTVLPNSRSLRLRAEQLAAQKNFTEAHDILVKARAARGASMDKAQRDEMERKIAMWQNTAENWEKVMDGIAKEDDKPDFIKSCANLAAKDIECWNWAGSESLDQMRIAQETNTLLVYTRATIDAISHTTSPTEVGKMRQILQKLEQAFQECSSAPIPFRAKLMERAMDAKNELGNTLNAYASLQKMMLEYERIEQTDDIVRKLQETAKEFDAHLEIRTRANRPASMIVQRQCAAYLAPMLKLQRSHDRLLKNYEAIASFDFNDFQPNLPLPESDACAAVSSLSSRRLDLEEANSNLKSIMQQIKHFCDWFDTELPAGKSTLLDTIFDRKTTDATLSFDCLDSKMPSYTDEKATSVYDNILGVYVFYAYLDSLESDFDTSIFDQRFKPALFKASDLFSRLEFFKNFCRGQQPNSKFYRPLEILMETAPRRNRLLERMEAIEKILKRRDAYVRELYGIFRRDSGSRRGIVAGGIACHLKTSQHDFLDDSFNKQVYDSFSKLHRELVLIKQEGNGQVTPEKLLELERKLLRRGIPGDQLLKQPWTDRFK